MNDIPSNKTACPHGVPATYHEADLPAYRGNPLIEALPPIYSEVEARDSLKYYPVVNPTISARPPHIRAQAKAADFFTPLPIHLALYKQLDRTVQSNYRTHNLPMSEYWSGKEQAGQSPSCTVNTKDE